jgi:peptidoglycan/LPS O-acetylase OafA/YrhL
LYWPLLLIALRFTSPISNSPIAITTRAILFGSDWYAAFGAYPAQGSLNFPTDLNQAWSLGAEVTFYAFAPLLVRSWQASLSVLLLSAACRAGLVHVFHFDVTWTYHFFPSTVMFFLLGHFARVIGEKAPTRTWVGPALLAASVLVSVLSIRVENWDNVPFYLGIILFAASLPGIFTLSKESRWMARFGDLSYPMYLTHKLVLTAIYGLFPAVGLAIQRHDGRLPEGLVSVGAVTVFCLLGSILAHWLIEKPASRLMRRGLSLRPARSTSEPDAAFASVPDP